MASVPIELHIHTLRNVACLMFIAHILENQKWAKIIYTPQSVQNSMEWTPLNQIYKLWFAGCEHAE